MRQRKHRWWQWRILAAVSFCCFSSLAIAPTRAQQVQVTTPLVGVRDSYYEFFGIDWGFHFRGPKGYVFFNSGDSSAAFPAFGGFNPNGAAHFGFGSRGPNGGFGFRLTADQGSSRTLVSSSASLVVPNGGSGFIQDVTWHPFVTGFVPVVGDAPLRPMFVLSSPLAERLSRLQQGERSPPADESPLPLAAPADSATAAPRPAVQNPIRSTAERGDVSLAEIRSQRAASAVQSAEELDSLIQTARLAEASGRFGAARVRYRQAAERAPSPLKEELWAKFESLAGK